MPQKSRRTLLKASGTVWLVPTISMVSLPSHAQATGTTVGPVVGCGPDASQSFDSPGTYTYTVPDDVSSLTIRAVGGSGGGGSGGAAGATSFTIINGSDTSATGGSGAQGFDGETVEQTVSVSAGEVLTIVVGSGGVGGESEEADLPVDTSGGPGRGGSGNPDGESGSTASSVIGGHGGGAGGTSTVSGGGVNITASGGAGGGGGGGAWAMDISPTSFTGDDASGTTAGNNQGSTNRFFDPAFVPDLSQDGGGDGAAGYVGAGNSGSGGSGGAGGSATGSRNNTIENNGITGIYTGASSSAGDSGADGSVKIICN